MPAPPSRVGRILGAVAVLLSIPVGLFLGGEVRELTSWHPAPPPPRPHYLYETQDPPATAAVAAASKPAKRAASVHYHSDWTSYDAAMAESKRTGKPVMIDFSADWCGPCQRLKAQVFEVDRYARQVEDIVIPVSIVDRVAELGSNPEEIEYLQHEYQANAFPTIVVVSARTKMMTRTQGFAGPDEAVAWIRESARLLR